jgi:hypothetical protein
MLCQYIYINININWIKLIELESTKLSMLEELALSAGNWKVTRRTSDLHELHRFGVVWIQPDWPIWLCYTMLDFSILWSCMVYLLTFRSSIARICNTSCVPLSRELLVEPKSILARVEARINVDGHGWYLFKPFQTFSNMFIFLLAISICSGPCESVWAPCLVRTAYHAVLLQPMTGLILWWLRGSSAVVVCEFCSIR